MSSNKLKVQAFRANDLSDDTGKQFELGRSWCDFLEVDDSVGDITFTLLFKPISKAHEYLKDRQIELKLSALTARNDRKAYANGAKSGHSAIKEFFLEDLHLTSRDNSADYFAVYKASESDYYLYYIPKLLHDNFIRFFESITPIVSIHHSSEEEIKISKSLQQIFYGAPGTGKSHKIKNNENVKKADEKNLVIRTTFHPDSDYSTFVGAYKPTMKPVADKYKAVVGKDEEIIYEFIPQAFLQAYVAAWNNPEENVFMIIEEINRGNCAQIFGDLFQLLDRDDNGFSEYPIKADRDLTKYLCGKDEKGNDILNNKDGIKDGKLKLPPNLYIWATMNTSDQSLFPIDSAFKRRWEWKYVKIKNHPDKNYQIVVGEESPIPWWDFIQKINEIIASMTSSADKQLGYFFCKADKSGNISAETFVSKVIFYLWNDVFKDYGFEDASLFRYTDKEGTERDLTFPDFYDEAGEKVDTERLADFLKRVMEWKANDKSNDDK